MPLAVVLNSGKGNEHSRPSPRIKEPCKADLEIVKTYVSAGGITAVATLTDEQLENIESKEKGEANIQVRKPSIRTRGPTLIISDWRKLDLTMSARPFFYSLVNEQRP